MRLGETHIIFDHCFSNPLSNALDNCKSLTHIIFGYTFNCTLEDLLDNCSALTHLGLGYNFKQKNDLRFRLRSPSLNSNNKFYTEHLDTVEELELGELFNLELDNCPSSIKKLIFIKYSNYNKELNCLPPGMSILQLPRGYNQQIQNIPPGLKKLICSKNYPYCRDFVNKKIEIVIY